jgi:DNA-binding transcriptional MocR family regulator
VRWTRPQGGLFLWVTLPEGMNAAEILPMAVKNKVAYVPGGSFFPNGAGANTFRLNFSNAQPAQIEEGIRRLGEVLSEAVGAAGAVGVAGVAGVAGVFDVSVR